MCPVFAYSNSIDNRTAKEKAGLLARFCRDRMATAQDRWKRKMKIMKAREHLGIGGIEALRPPSDGRRAKINFVLKSRYCLGKRKGVFSRLLCKLRTNIPARVGLRSLSVGPRYRTTAVAPILTCRRFLIRSVDRLRAWPPLNFMCRFVRSSRCHINVCIVSRVGVSLLKGSGVIGT